MFLTRSQSKGARGGAVASGVTLAMSARCSSEQHAQTAGVESLGGDPYPEALTQ
jgi:hypothetical protein